MSDRDQDPLVFRFGAGATDGDAARVDVLGGKGASLAAMCRAGFPVPPGFTISATCGAWAESHGGAWPPGLLEQIRTAMGWLEQATGRSFGRGSKPLLVAVRSGAAVSMPGMMDTILNCGSDPAVDPWVALTQAINAVFASWHSDRSRAYRQHHDVRGVVGTAVNVQAMFPSERSGVLFTVNPNNPAANEILIEASWGLGEAVVSGAVTPDISVLDAETLATKRVTPGSRPGTEAALTDNQLRALAELGRRVATHFQAPSDIEWGISDGEIALLQTRRIRGLDILADVECGRRATISRLRALANTTNPLPADSPFLCVTQRDSAERQALMTSSDEEAPPCLWVVHNLSETLPAPTPLTWDLARWFMSAAGGYGRLYRLLGHRPHEQHAGTGFLELIAGRIYADPRRAAEFHFGRLPFEYDLQEVLRDRTAIDRPPTRFNPDRADSVFIFRWPARLFGMLRSARRCHRLQATIRERFESITVPKLEGFLAEVSRAELPNLSTPELLAELRRRRDFVLGEFAAESLLPGYFGGLAHERLRRMLAQLFGDHDGEQLASQLTTGLANDITVEQNIALAELAAGGQSLDDFLGRFGHRAANEMELSQPRWREDRDLVTRMADRLRTASGPSPRERHAAQVESRQQAERSLAARLVDAGGSSFHERIVHDLRQAQNLLPYREVGKFHLMRGYETLRAVLVELGRRWDLGRDVFFLDESALPSFEADPSRWQTWIAQHKLRWQSFQRLSLPDVIDSRQLDDLGKPRPVAVHSRQSRFPCRPIASGAGRGTARIVFAPSDVADLGRDAILVCPSTDPGWTPLFLQIKGLIVERGGLLSHGAIVARDFGIPAVVLESATQIIPNGSTVELDANHGEVIIAAKQPR